MTSISTYDEISVISQLRATLETDQNDLYEKFKQEWIQAKESEKTFEEFMQVFFIPPVQDALSLILPQIEAIKLVAKKDSDIHFYPANQLPMGFKKKFLEVSNDLELMTEIIFDFSDKHKCHFWAILLEKKKHYLLLTYAGEFRRKTYTRNFLVEVAKLVKSFFIYMLNLWKIYENDWQWRKIPQTTLPLYTTIQSLRLKGIRAFKDTSKLEIRPITLLIGPNNAGKSSFWKSLLMLSQTQNDPSHRPLLKFSEAYVDFGSFANLVHQKKKPFRFGIELDYQNSEQSPAHLQLNFILDTNQQAILKSLVCTSKNNELKLQYHSPQEYEAHFKRVLNKNIENKKQVLFVSSKNLFSFLHSICEQLKLPYIFPNLGDSVQLLSSYRQLVQRVYILTHTNDDFLAPDGSNLADYLELQPHISKMNEWLTFFGLGKTLAVERAGGDALYLKIQTRHKELSLPDMGTGVGNLVYTIAAGFTPKSAPGVLIIENPEHHLHPKGQMDLANLFHDMQQHSPQRHLLIETHSEYMMLRFRTLIAEGALQPKDFIIHYFKPDPISGTTTVHPMCFDQDGEFEEGSVIDGFFKEGYEESQKQMGIILEKYQKSRGV